MFSKASSQEKLFAFFVLLLLLPWLVIAARMAANSDILWLSTELTRVLHGQRMTAAAYEPNPPFSLLTTFVPLAMSWTGLPLHIAIIVYAVAAVVLSVLAIVRILRSWPEIEPLQACVVAAAFAAAETVCTSGASLGERDHLIALGLIPFTLIQLAISARRTWPRVTGWLSLVLGGFLILLKPHFGLFPTLIIAQRAFSRRSLNVVRDPDFLVLAFSAIIYPLATWLLFPDWVNQILPEVIKLYLAVRDPGVTVQSLSMAGGVLVLMVALRFSPLTPESRRLGLWLALGALASIVPYWVQGRNYFYHLLPAAGYFAAALSLLLYPLMRREAGAVRGAYFAAMLLVGIAYAVTPPNPHYPTHAQYSGFPLSRIVATCDGQGDPCPFMIFSDGMSPVMETAYYTRAPYVSRFPSFWFLPKLLATGDNALPRAEAARLFSEYASMTADDLNTAKPQLVILGHFGIDGRPFDFARYFGENPAFAAAWQHYRFDRQVMIDRKVYGWGSVLREPAIIPYDIYRRLPD